ncbi:MAG: carbohydrate kinase family protein [Clostridiaceae bacterium]|nr:carbohydrate kinase family protein [Clostridiaceae bacterium]
MSEGSLAKVTLSEAFSRELRNSPGGAWDRLICYGDVCADLIIPYGKIRDTLDRMQADVQDIDPQAVEFRSGGSVGNVVRLLARLGEPPVFMTQFGNDRTGDYLRKALESLCVDLSFAETMTFGSLICIAVLDKQGDRTMFVWCPPWGGYTSFSSASFPGGLLQGNNLIFSSGMLITDDAVSGNHLISHLESQKRHGATIVFDLNVRAESYGLSPIRRRQFEQILELCDIVLGSGIEEFGPFTDCQYLPEAARIMAKSGLTVVARDGPNPIHFATPLEYEEIAVEAIAVKANTIGAGDGFDAGFLRALYAGLPLRSCIDLGSYTARQLISGAWER